MQPLTACTYQLNITSTYQYAVFYMHTVVHHSRTLRRLVYSDYLQVRASLTSSATLQCQSLHSQRQWQCQRNAMSRDSMQQ
jgi:hypothetical protein